MYQPHLNLLPQGKENRNILTVNSIILEFMLRNIDAIHYESLGENGELHLSLP